MTTFKLTFDDGESHEIQADYIRPELKNGWWSYDYDGLEVYTKDSKKVQLGDTIYFHVNTNGLVVGTELKFQLFDYDYFWWMGEHIDEYNMDTSKFPNDPVIKTAKVRAFKGKSIATVGLHISETWEPVVADDHDDMFSLDQTIELYWKVSYTNANNYTIKEELPGKKENYLRVGYNTKNLFIKPAVEHSNLPEFYDYEGKLIIFGFKKANDIAKNTGFEGKISNVVLTKIRVTTETTLVSELNSIRQKIYKEEINLTTNEISKKIGYEVEEASNFVIKNTTSYVDIDETTKMTRKKFSEYFNKVDFKEGTVGALRNGRELIRFYDYLQVGKTIHSLFPRGGGSTGIPKPSSVVSVFSTFSGKLGFSNAASQALTGIGTLFVATDIIAEQEVTKIMQEMNQYGEELIQLHKHKGLRALERLIDQTRADEFSGYILERNISQEAHEKVLSGKIKSFEELENYKEETISENTYTYTY